MHLLGPFPESLEPLKGQLVAARILNGHNSYPLLDTDPAVFRKVHEYSKLREVSDLRI
jgi:hypothetical protein